MKFVRDVFSPRYGRHDEAANQTVDAAGSIRNIRRIAARPDAAIQRSRSRLLMRQCDAGFCAEQIQEVSHTRVTFEFVAFAVGNCPRVVFVEQSLNLSNLRL